ncbi:MAG TPA: acyltransferase [Solirubrobacteraceae bacterium]|nr:acyltransferase [Solirubrobacteraceae bacterium]
MALDLAPPPAPAPLRAPAEAPRADRFRQLDSLRGLAALAVVLTHLLVIFPVMERDTWGEEGRLGVNLLKYTPLHSLWGGHEAVILFFVLSGFVLATSFLRPSGAPGYRDFLIRRVWRLYPAYLAVLAASIAAREAFAASRPDTLSDWVDAVWSAPASASEIVKHALLVPTFNDEVFDPVLWSLTHEMRISLVFPLVMLAVVRLPWWQSLGGAVALSGFTFVVTRVAGHYDTFITAHYLLMFVAGALVALHRDTLVTAYRGLGRWVKIGLAAWVVLLYSWLHLLPTVGALHVGPTGDWLTTTAVAAIIVAALGSVRLREGLLRRPLVFAGDISYSLYLVHAVVLVSALSLLYGDVPTALILVGVVPVSVGLAMLLRRYVELPGIDVGRRLTRRRPAA